MQYTDGTVEGWCADTAEEVPAILEKHGVCILHNVLTSAQCDEMRDKAWDTFETITQDMDVPLKRDNLATYATLNVLNPHHGMLHQHFGAGYGLHGTMLRNMIACSEPFAKIWDTKKLLVSFDGCSFAPPLVKEDTTDESTMMHLDQSLHPDSRGKKKWFQSWVTSEDVSDGDGTLQFIAGGAHRLHKEFAEYTDVCQDERVCKQLKNKSDWFVVSDKKGISAELQWYLDKGCNVRRIKCPKGSMVFWDSRVPHTGVHGKRTNLRNVVYLCYLPVERCDAPNLMAKRKEMHNPDAGDRYLRTCAHPPDKMRMFAVYPIVWPRKPRAAMDEYFSKVSLPPHPEYNEHGKRVCGLCPWPRC
jgi:hypothetical protein